MLTKFGETGASIALAIRYNIHDIHHGYFSSLAGAQDAKGLQNWVFNAESVLPSVENEARDARLASRRGRD